LFPWVIAYISESWVKVPKCNAPGIRPEVQHTAALIRRTDPLRRGYAARRCNQPFSRSLTVL